jgi:acyl carrier protein
MQAGLEPSIVTIASGRPKPGGGIGGSVLDQVREAIAKYIVDEFLDGAPSALSDAGANLIETEVIDSLGIFLLVDFLQARFGIEIDAEEISIENFTSVESIAALVVAKQAAG